MSFTVCLTWIFVLSKRYIHTLCHNVLVLTVDINNNDSCHWVPLHKVHLYVSYAVCPHKAGLQETVYCMKTYLKVCKSFTTDKRYQLMALHNAGMLEIMKNKIKTSWLGQTNKQTKEKEKTASSPFWALLQLTEHVSNYREFKIFLFHKTRLDVMQEAMKI
jgi:hypothetical protein